MLCHSLHAHTWTSCKHCSSAGSGREVKIVTHDTDHRIVPRDRAIEIFAVSPRATRETRRRRPPHGYRLPHPPFPIPQGSLVGWQGSATARIAWLIGPQTHGAQIAKPKIREWLCSDAARVLLGKRSMDGSPGSPLHAKAGWAGSAPRDWLAWPGLARRWVPLRLGQVTLLTCCGESAGIPGPPWASLAHAIQGQQGQNTSSPKGQPTADSKP